MSRRNRLVILLLSLGTLVCTASILGINPRELLDQFWFTAGLLLLILLALVDQPFFSKDANIFVNGATAWVSLLIVKPADRDWPWWLFFGWSTYLIVASYCLMWFRSKELRDEP